MGQLEKALMPVETFVQGISQMFSDPQAVEFGSLVLGICHALIVASRISHLISGRNPNQ